MAGIAAEQSRTEAAEQQVAAGHEAAMASAARAAWAVEEAGRQLVAVEAARQAEAMKAVDSARRRVELEALVAASERSVGSARSEAAAAKADAAALSARATAAAGAEAEVLALRGTVEQQRQNLRSAEGQIDTLRMSVRYSPPRPPPPVGLAPSSPALAPAPRPSRISRSEASPSQVSPAPCHLLRRRRCCSSHCICSMPAC